MMPEDSCLEALAVKWPGLSIVYRYGPELVGQFIQRNSRFGACTIKMASVGIKSLFLSTSDSLEEKTSQLYWSYVDNAAHIT